MAGDNQKKAFLILTVFISVVAVALTVAAFATDNWVNYNISHLNSTANYTSTSNMITAEGGFGLFRGNSHINYGFGVREKTSEVICTEGWCTYYTISTTSKIDTNVGKDYLSKLISNYTIADGDAWEYGVFRMGYWVSILIMLAMGIVWGLVSIGFTVYNIFGKPIETITGPLGLYIWNFCAVVFMFISVIIFVVLYETNFSKNVLPHDDYIVFKPMDNINLDFSFFLTVAALIGYIINVVLLMCSGYKLGCACTREADKAIDNGIILY